MIVAKRRFLWHVYWATGSEEKLVFLSIYLFIRLYQYRLKNSYFMQRILLCSYHYSVGQIVLDLASGIRPPPPAPHQSASGLYQHTSTVF